MREYKFRAKRIDNGEWVYGYYWTNENGNYFIRKTVDLNGCFTIEDIEVDPNTVGQYIGLKDKNSVEIYEGDIVKDAWGINMLVKYINTGFYLCRKNTNGEYSKISNWRNLQTKEVIGNIYNNPELLKGE